MVGSFNVIPNPGRIEFRLTARLGPMVRRPVGVVPILTGFGFVLRVGSVGVGLGRIRLYRGSVVVVGFVEGMG